MMTNVYKNYFHLYLVKMFHYNIGHPSVSGLVKVEVVWQRPNNRNTYIFVSKVVKSPNCVVKK